ncbi:MAG: DUF4388 domain-containing protein [Planctomycetota bacterium]|jgi:hypothetical protein
MSDTARREAFFKAVGEEQKLPAAEIARSMARYPETVLDLFVTLHADEGPHGFNDAFRLFDLLDNLGCHDYDVPDAGIIDPIVLSGKQEDERPFQISLSAEMLNLDRNDLLRLLKQRLGIERPTRQTAVIRPRKPSSGDDDAPRRSPSGKIVFAGFLRQMPLEDLVQLFQLQRKTGALEIRESPEADSWHGTVGFTLGEIVDATWGPVAVPDMKPKTGEEAFYAIAKLTDGEFRFHANATIGKTIDQPTNTLLMEAMRRKDETG